MIFNSPREKDADKREIKGNLASLNCLALKYWQLIGIALP